MLSKYIYLYIFFIKHVFGIFKVTSMKKKKKKSFMNHSFFELLGVCVILS